jgi:hypothetical protein
MDPMKLQGIILIIAMFIFEWAQGGAATLKGQWRMTDMIYKGQEMPPPNPDLNLSWTFFENGTERLYWQRKDEEGFCERFANYHIGDNQIQEKVFAVNPLNKADCGTDPDMQVGRETFNKIEIQQQRILFHLQVGEEEVIFILKEVL